VDAYRTEDADFLFITSGTAGHTARVAVDDLRAEGIKAGNLRIILFRPFPFAVIRQYLKNVRRAAVLDRNLSYGHHGIFYQEVKSALYGYDGMPPVHGFVAGLGGRDITPGDYKEIYRTATTSGRPTEEIGWIGVKR